MFFSRTKKIPVETVIRNREFWRRMGDTLKKVDDKNIKPVHDEVTMTLRSLVDSGHDFSFIFRALTVLEEENTGTEQNPLTGEVFYSLLDRARSLSRKKRAAVFIQYHQYVFRIDAQIKTVQDCSARPDSLSCRFYTKACVYLGFSA